MRVVFPASGCEMMANVRLRRISSSKFKAKRVASLPKPPPRANDSATEREFTASSMSSQNLAAGRPPSRGGKGAGTGSRGFFILFRRWSLPIIGGDVTLGGFEPAVAAGGSQFLFRARGDGAFLPGKVPSMRQLSAASPDRAGWSRGCWPSLRSVARHDRPGQYVCQFGDRGGRFVACFAGGLAASSHPRGPSCRHPGRLRGGPQNPGRSVRPNFGRRGWPGPCSG